MLVVVSKVVKTFSARPTRTRLVVAGRDETLNAVIAKVAEINTALGVLPN
jgi:hypothetical protein